MVNKNTNSIIVALSDVPTMTIISYHLERYGFVVNAAQKTDNLLSMIESIDPYILIIDEDLQGDKKAKDICAMLKANPRTNQIKILFASFADYSENNSYDSSIKKPFVPSEMVKKIKSLTEQVDSLPGKKIISYYDIEMNLSTFKVMRNGRQIHLGPNEFKILQCFVELPGKVLSREHIMNYVWGHNSQVEQRTIDVHINRLRAALRNNDDELPLIRTVRSSGYSLCAPREVVRA